MENKILGSDSLEYGSNSAEYGNQSEELSEEQNEIKPEGLPEEIKPEEAVAGLKDHIIENGSIVIEDPFPGIIRIGVNLTQDNTGVYIHIRYPNKKGSSEGITISLTDDGKFYSSDWNRNNLSDAVGLDLTDKNNREILENNIWSVLTPIFAGGQFKQTIKLLLEEDQEKRRTIFVRSNDEKEPPTEENTVIPEFSGKFDARIELYDEVFEDLVKGFPVGEKESGDVALVGRDYIIFTSHEYSNGLYLLPIPKEYGDIDFKNLTQQEFEKLIDQIFPNIDKNKPYDIKTLKEHINQIGLQEGIAIEEESSDPEKSQYRINHPDHENIETDEQERARFLERLARGIARHFGPTPTYVGSGKKLEPTVSGKIMEGRR